MSLQSEQNIHLCNNALSYNASINVELFKICDPLFSNFGITDFGYIRYYFDGSSFMLETNHDWMVSCYSQISAEDTNNPFSELQNLKSAPLNDIYVYPYIGEPKTFIHSFLLQSNMWNGISVYKRHRDFGEAFHFQSSIENVMLPTYLLNNLELIKRFILYFTEKSRPLLISKAIPRITLYSPEDMSDLLRPNASDNGKIQSFLDTTQLKKIWIPTSNLSLSMREINCLYHLSCGKTTKEIARILNISPRTVESYENSAKQKFEVTSKTELIKIFEDIILNNISKYESDTI